MPFSKMPPELSTDRILLRARKLHLSGELDQAMAGYDAVLKHQPENSDALYLVGLIIYRQGDVEKAIESVLKAIEISPEHVLAHASLAQIFQDKGDHKRALLYFRRATELDSTKPEFFNGLGLSLAYLGKQASAQKAFDRALELNPEMLEALNNQGNLQRALGNPDEAERIYLHCLELQPDFVQVLNNLGVLNQQRQNPSSAIKYFESAISARADYAEAHNNLGAVLIDQGKTERALYHLRQALKIQPAFSEACINAGMAMQISGQHQSARVMLDRALEIEPDNLSALWVRCVCELESIYSSEKAIGLARLAYQSRLDALRSYLECDDSLQSGLAAVAGSIQPFLLPYQGRDDKNLQATHGEILCNTAPSGGSAQNLVSRKPGPVRVGIVSAFFYDHSNWKVPIQGWLKYLHSQFEVTIYHTGTRHDRATEVAKALCTRFYSGLAVQQFIEVIKSDAVDFLIYPEIGMHPVTTHLATQRLAKVQCASWGHPVTSGLPTMDYFLSSELMEPEGADVQYSEKLIRLPGLSFSWTVPEYDTATEASRDQFGFSRKDIICLCVQNLSKYLPQHDNLLVEIATQVADTRMIFVEGAENITVIFKNRLQACFESAGLDFKQRVIFLARLNRDDYHALNIVADIFLDTVEWSGCNSTLEALSCDLPVVTLPGQWMRGRHSYAIYQQMEYDALIAKDEKNYIELAVRLATDVAWREQQREIISRQKYRLVEDDAPVQGLVEFIKDLVEE